MRVALTVLVLLSAPFAYGAVLGSGMWLQTALASSSRGSGLMWIYPAYLLAWLPSAIWTARIWFWKSYQPSGSRGLAVGIINLVLFLLLGSAFLAACLFAYVVLNWGDA